MNTTLQNTEKEVLLSIARESIASQLQGRMPNYPDEEKEELIQECGVFVTLHIGPKLRGCIGTMHGSEPLIDAVKDMARSSAFHDPRFPRLAIEELDLIKIEISVLTPLKPMQSVDEIEIGKHGLYISKGPFSGVLLPQVADERGWEREEFLAFTCRKAGLPADAWRDVGVEIFTFTAIIFSESDSNA